MTAPNHLITGAIIALSIQQPAAAIPLSYISHFALDALPHFGTDTNKDIFERNKQWSFRIYLSLGVLGTFILVPILLIWLGSMVSIWMLAACMLAANLPDLVWVKRFFYEIRTKKERPKGKISQFHVWIQRLDRPWGWTFELTWFCVGIYLLFKLT